MQTEMVAVQTFIGVGNILCVFYDCLSASSMEASNPSLSYLPVVAGKKTKSNAGYKIADLYFHFL